MGSLKQNELEAATMQPCLTCFILVLQVISIAAEEDKSGGDKICWLLADSKNYDWLVSEEFIENIKNVKDSAEIQLGKLDNGRIKEIEIEFENQIEATIHFISDENNEELFCMSKT